MEPLLSGDKLSAELEFAKRQIDVLGSLKTEHANDFVLPEEHRPKRATVANIRVTEPPAVSSGDEPEKREMIELTIKSTKPPLNVTLSVASTSSISSAKAQLAASDPSAPPPESQRWILKGKAMGDTKLLKEFAIEGGAATVNLMVSKAPAAAAASGATATDLDAPPAASDPPTPASVGPDPLSLGPIPALTLSTDPMPSPTNPAAPKLSITTNLGEGTDFMPPSAPANGDSEAFTATIGDPELWIETYAMLLRRFGNDEKGQREAKKVWEAWLAGARDWISPGTKALIRERTGISAMGGEA